MKKALWMILAVLLLLSAPFWGAFVYGKIENRKMRNEITEYVLENKVRIEVTETYQTVPYASTGLAIAGMDYGYYYDANDRFNRKGIPYRKGFRTDGYPDEPSDWYYTERICENWFYYEVHDG